MKKQNQKRKRTGKWYSKNEKETLEGIGLTPTPMSGAGFLAKEDGYNDKIIAQLKSTDAMSYRLTIEDLNKLKYHAMVEHKLPLFITQFLQTDELYLTLRYEDLKDICLSLMGVKDISELEYDPKSQVIDDMQEEHYCEDSDFELIKGNVKAREKFYEKREKEWKKSKIKGK